MTETQLYPPTTAGKSLWNPNNYDMPRYTDDWEEIARSLKERVNWKCQKCGMQCLRPGEDTSTLSKTERSQRTLNVHHHNRIPEDNRPDNLIALCTGCHLSYHNRGQSNISMGQLELPL